MVDLGHDLLFGAFLTPTAAGHQRVVDLAVAAEEAGLDLVGVQDHPYQPAFLDTWTLLSNLAARTSRIRLFPDVVNLPLRAPAVLARAAASLDVLSGGRLELGIGAGAFWDGVEAMGGPRRTPGEAVDALAEAIGVLRALWTAGPPVHLDGRHYQLRGAQPGPPPSHPIGIWVGSYGPRMLRLTGALADGWVPSAAYAPPEQLAEMTKTLEAAAEQAGRDPAAVRRIYNLNGRFATRSGGGFLDGPPASWAEQLAELALADGFSAFVLAPGPAAERDLAAFAAEVAPAVRALVARERGAPAPEPAVRMPPAVRGPLDEAARPRLPKGALADLTPGQRALSQHLAAVHDQYRDELSRVQEVVDEVAGGAAAADELRSLVDRMTLRQNLWTMGTFCASYCRLVTVHHTIEDTAMFPELARRDPSLAAVVQRLEAEHEVIAGLLADLDAALAALIVDPAALPGVRDQVDLLAATLLSHFAYEEEELSEPIGRLELRI